MLKQSAVRAVRCRFQLNAIWWHLREWAQKSFHSPGLASASLTSRTLLPETHILQRSQKIALGTMLTRWYASYHLLASNCPPHTSHPAILQLCIPTDTILISSVLLLQMCSQLKQNKFTHQAKPAACLGSIWGTPVCHVPLIENRALPRQFHQLHSKEHTQIHID